MGASCGRSLRERKHSTARVRSMRAGEQWRRFFGLGDLLWPLIFVGFLDHKQLRLAGSAVRSGNCVMGVGPRRPILVPVQVGRVVHDSRPRHGGVDAPMKYLPLLPLKELLAPNNACGAPVGVDHHHMLQAEATMQALHPMQRCANGNHVRGMVHIGGEVDVGAADVVTREAFISQLHHRLVQAAQHAASVHNADEATVRVLLVLLLRKPASTAPSSRIRVVGGDRLHDWEHHLPRREPEHSPQRGDAHGRRQHVHRAPIATASNARHDVRGTLIAHCGLGLFVEEADLLEVQHDLVERLAQDQPCTQPRYDDGQRLRQQYADIARRLDKQHRDGDGHAREAAQERGGANFGVRAGRVLIAVVAAAVYCLHALSHQAPERGP
mmetsp:Transcript_10370/g.42898  ORF Transcript_10370/g.42898 Transcript_10370/m.42898 type:complete len:382 (+) Transcript_10370:1329-2474(+)